MLFIMRLMLLAALACGSLAAADGPRSFLAPVYSAASIVNAATYTPDSLAPNTLAAIFGVDLSWSKRELLQDDIKNNTLPTQLAGVHVTVAGVLAHLYYVSDKQVNFLIPSSLRPGPVDLVLVRDGAAGPTVRIALKETAPALFHTPDNLLLATHLDGSLVSEAAPSAGGEVIVLYATGLGHTAPDAIYGQIPTMAQPLARNDFVLWLAGERVERERILYAGVTPGFAGLYQINLRLPNPIARDPEVRIGFGETMSTPDLKIVAGR